MQAEKLQLVGRESDCQKLHAIIDEIGKKYDGQKEGTKNKDAEKEGEKKTTVIVMNGEAGIGLISLDFFF